ncbi:glycerol kinase GlpK [Halopseudomonas aestusnigri]|jgi:glycerol kinase|uniref:glycerol kinase GlpK n=1 Tax=Halopseudomonas TaxID=2901189 RepID=UPI000C96BF8F|nr:glycerol kinase GlpK [Halopseudomonas aestusnigri]MAH01333.1 glycerol kinase [Pseudomonadales bacterium]MEE2798256.1 glycerol kinase GlpK [Pseudomonadota bacterium]HBT56207.1 glycerol kinase [Pseudomonas sp.]MAK74363.1 glycerol kinase [Pseudomonadales bacterium]MAP75956.1 glycerol kinase [Pseudomonadales bacterium]|tara:strand:- start:7 stop:1488 length:1482 start_codon:yes stop_codon:yes gene_type:complete
MAKPILAIDQGTTSSRAILFSASGRPEHVAQQEFAQHFPNDGWVEHDGEEIWSSTLAVCREVLEKAGISASEVAGIGITNQRETTLVWDAASGELLYRAIVWQDRRTASYCAELKAAGHEAMISERTGLLIDPYFSATKLRWILDNVPGARARAERNELRFGTVDCFLLWRLTGGKVHRTDATNASRTMLFNIHTQQWDDDLLQLLDIPASLLPEVMDSAADFGQTAPEVLGASIPVCGIAGDQQAALIGQACFEPGMVKSTYGTGCFMVMNTGSTPIRSQNRLLTTVGYRLNGQTSYALEGSIFVAGAAIQWLRDGLKLIQHAGETEALARQAGEHTGVYLVPAFTGLGAPYWDPTARGAIFGLTRDTGIAQIVAAGLQSVCFQTRDLLEAMQADGAQSTAALRVDGGMVINNWVVQELANILGVTVDRPQVTETTALGAAYLAGLQLGIFKDLDDIASHWACERTFAPEMAETQRDALYEGWLDAIRRVRE